MPGRRLYPHEPTWLNKSFQKSFAKLREDDRKAQRATLKALLNGLRFCSHVVTDPRLAEWKPKRHHGIQIPKAQLVEYRCKGRFRVVVVYFSEEDAILLFAATPEHDYDAIARQLTTYKADLKRWTPPPEEDESFGIDED